ncbi:hypothetical protein JW935_28585 [candidate division KSB1 bacterium]|nr:hypothetical protein [candidate division KSB1 bacterium]
MISLTQKQRDRLAVLRRHVIKNDHVLKGEEIADIQEEVTSWPVVGDLPPDHDFFEKLDLYESDGSKNGTQCLRGLCHWLWLRHACVHGMLFTPGRLVVLQQRSEIVSDSPGYLDISFAGHTGTKNPQQAARSEAYEEVNVDLEDANNLISEGDLTPLKIYNYIEPPRSDEEFYNVEIRFVFAVRISGLAVGGMFPRDREAGSILMATMSETWNLLRTHKIASALRFSGPEALYFAMKEWDWI